MIHQFRRGRRRRFRQWSRRRLYLLLLLLVDFHARVPFLRCRFLLLFIFLVVFEGQQRRRRFFFFFFFSYRLVVVFFIVLYDFFHVLMALVFRSFLRRRYSFSFKNFLLFFNHQRTTGGKPNIVQHFQPRNKRVHGHAIRR